MQATELIDLVLILAAHLDLVACRGLVVLSELRTWEGGSQLSTDRYKVTREESGQEQELLTIRRFILESVCWYMD